MILLPIKFYVCSKVLLQRKSNQFLIDLHLKIKLLVYLFVFLTKMKKCWISYWMTFTIYGIDKWWFRLWKKLSSWIGQTDHLLSKWYLDIFSKDWWMKFTITHKSKYSFSLTFLETCLIQKIKNLIAFLVHLKKKRNL